MILSHNWALFDLANLAIVAKYFCCVNQVGHGWFSFQLWSGWSYFHKWVINTIHRLSFSSVRLRVVSALQRQQLFMQLLINLIKFRFGHPLKTGFGHQLLIRPQPSILLQASVMDSKQALTASNTWRWESRYTPVIILNFVFTKSVLTVRDSRCSLTFLSMVSPKQEDDCWEHPPPSPVSIEVHELHFLPSSCNLAKLLQQ